MSRRLQAEINYYTLVQPHQPNEMRFDRWPWAVQIETLLASLWAPSDPVSRWYRVLR